MRLWDDFMPYVLPDVPGCPEIAAVQAVRNAAIEFCERTMLLQRDHDPITVVAGVVDYDFDPPTGYLVTKVMRVWFQKNELTPTVPDDVNNPTVYNSLAAPVTAAMPRNYIQKDERTFSLYPTPDTTAPNALTLRVALKPTRDSTSGDDVLYEDWVETIASGAKARLLSQNGRPYANGPLSGMHGAVFNHGINRALVRGYKGHTRANLSVQLRRL